MGLDYVIVGGLAAIIRGRNRTTMDIDIIVKNEPEKIVLFADVLQNNNFIVMKEQVLYALNEGFNITIFDKLSSIRLDIKPAKSTDEQEVLESAILEGYHDITIKIATIEQILYGKVMCIGAIDDFSDEELLGYNDVLDFCTLYNRYKNTLDMDWLMKKSKDLGLLETLERLINLEGNS
ncbi:MAG TPA: hypothetical protein VKM55_14880 [Candidatus Lokiarchaeia archaeon]|nr:hypothetical protein [Candidatus Lokiarchaeia archaeon]